MTDKKIERRDFLFTATYAVGAVGVGAVVWPMIDQMNPCPYTHLRAHET